MYKATVINHFKSASRVAEVLGLSRQAVSQWNDIIPEGVAYKLQFITGGDLSVNPALYPCKAKSAHAPSASAVDAA